MTNRGGLFINIDGVVSRHLLEGLATLREQMRLLKTSASGLRNISPEKGLDKLAASAKKSQSAIQSSMKSTDQSIDRIVSQISKYKSAITDLSSAELPQSRMKERFKGIDKQQVNDLDRFNKAVRDQSQIIADVNKQKQHYRQVSQQMTASDKTHMQSIGQLNQAQRAALIGMRNALPVLQNKGISWKNLTQAVHNYIQQAKHGSVAVMQQTREYFNLGHGLQNASTKAIAFREAMTHKASIEAAKAQIQELTHKILNNTKETQKAENQNRRWAKQIQELSFYISKTKHEVMELTHAIGRSAQQISKFGSMSTIKSSGTSVIGDKLKEKQALEAWKTRDWHAQWDARRMKIWGQELNQTSVIAEKFNKAMRIVNHRIKQFTAFVAAAFVVQGLRRAFGEIGRSIKDFDQGLRDLEAILNITHVEMDKLGEKVKQVAVDTKYSTTEVMDGMKLLGQAGLDTTEIIQSIDHVSALATGTLSEFKDVSDLVTTTIRAFHLDFLETGRVVDIFANAINRSKLTVEKLKVAFNYIAPVAHRANISLEETSASLMLLANAGIRASTMGTGFRRVLLDLMKPNTALQKAIADSGYTIRDFNPEFNDLATIFDRLAVVAPTASEAVHMFQTRALPIVMTFTTRGGDALKEFIETVREVGAASRMMAAQTEGLGIKFKQVADRFSVLAVTIGDAGVDRMLHGIADALRYTLSVMIAVVEQGFVPFIAKVGLLAIAIKGLVVLFPKFIFYVTGLTKILVGLRAIVVSTNVALATGATVALPAMITSLYNFAKAAIVAKGAAAGLVLTIKSIFTLLGGWVILGIATIIMGIVHALNRKEKALVKTHKQLERQNTELENLGNALELYLDKMEESHKKGEDYLIHLDRLINDFPQLVKELKDVSLEYDNVTAAMRRLREETAQQRIDGMVKQAEIAAQLLPKALHQVAQVEKLTEGESDFPGEHALIRLIGGYKGAQKIIQEHQASFSESAIIDLMREYVDGMGKSAKEASEAVIKHLEEISEQTGTSTADLIEFAQTYGRQLAIMREGTDVDFARMSSSWKELLSHFTEGAPGQYSKIATQIVHVWQQLNKDLEDLIAHHNELGDSISEEDKIGERWELLAGAESQIKELTGLTIDLNGQFANTRAALNLLGPSFRTLYENMGAIERLDFSKKINEIEDELRELSLELARSQPNIDIKHEIDQERIRRLAELAASTYSAEFQRTMHRLQIMENSVLLGLEQGSVEALKQQEDFARRRFEIEQKELQRLRDSGGFTQDRINQQILSVQRSESSWRAAQKSVNDAILKEDQDYYDKKEADRKADLQRLQNQQDLQFDILKAKAELETNELKQIELNHKNDLIALERDHQERLRSAAEDGVSVEYLNKLYELEKDIAERVFAERNTHLQRLQNQNQQDLQFDILKAKAKLETNELKQIELNHKNDLIALERDHQERLKSAREDGVSVEYLTKLHELEKEIAEGAFNEAVTQFEQEQALKEIGRQRELLDIQSQHAQIVGTKREQYLAEVALLENRLAEEELKEEEGSERILALRELHDAQRLQMERDFQNEMMDLQLEADLEQARLSKDREAILIAEIAQKKAILERARNKYYELGVEGQAAFLKIRKEVQELEQELSRLQAGALEAFKLGIDDGVEEMQSLSEMMYDFGNDILPKFGNDAASAWMSFVDGSKSAKDAMEDFAKSTLKYIAEVITRMIIMNAIKSAFGYGGEVSPAATSRSSGDRGTYALQGLADGGEIQGHSPTPTSDNILARVTAGEWIMPVKAVKHFGEDFMESIQNLEVPQFSSGGKVPHISSSRIAKKEKDTEQSDQKEPQINFVVNVENQVSGAEVEMKPPKFDGVRWVAEMFVTAAHHNVSGIRDVLGSRA